MTGVPPDTGTAAWATAGAATAAAPAIKVVRASFARPVHLMSTPSRPWRGRPGTILRDSLSTHEPRCIYAASGIRVREVSILPPAEVLLLHRDPQRRRRDGVSPRLLPDRGADACQEQLAHRVQQRAH